LKANSFYLAATLLLSAVALPAYAQHSMTPEQKAEAAAKKAEAEAAAAGGAAQAAAEVPAGDIDTSERTIWDGVFTAAQAEAGKALYTTNCQTCHGATGRGGPGGPGITGAYFNKRWVDSSVLDFYTFAHTQMPPGKAGTIGNEQDYVNIVAYVLDMHGADPGTSELVYNEDQLGNIFIVKKP
jgi:mono/diheme cytochrome c family protein